MGTTKQAAELFLTLALCVIVLSSAIPKPADGEKADHSTRVLDKELSDQEHFDGDGHEDHNTDYDHEAFLGDDYKTFDDLTPEESKERLAIIYDKIDKDGDGLVTEHELKSWIQHVQNKYIEEDTARQWTEHGTDDTIRDVLTWDQYKMRTYGFLDDKDDAVDEDGGYSYQEMLRRDQRRWERADTDGDKALSLKEFQHFLHPEESDHMRDIVIDETIEDIDKDGDGQISLEEYIGDMWPNSPEEGEPDWVKTEREQFVAFRDKNKDGEMDRHEVADWIMPADYDHSEAETRHLIFESDGNRDNMLSKEEVLEKYDLFVGSQATDFGEALTRHDEF